MIIPPTLKIGPFIWEIKESEEVANEGNVYGSTHHSKQKIFLEPSETQQKKEQVLIHETMHVIWHQAGLGKRYDKDHPRIEEEVVHALSMGLYQVLKDNDLLK